MVTFLERDVPETASYWHLLYCGTFHGTRLYGHLDISLIRAADWEVSMNKTYIAPELNTIEGLSAQLLDLNRRLQDSEKLRTQMLENISHDLRAPLTAIRSSIDCLLECDSLDASEINDLIRIINQRSKHLETLVNDLYYLTCIDNNAPNYNMHYQCINAGEFLEEYFYNCRCFSSTLHRELILDVPVDFPFTISIDPDKMTRVLDNLITNAVKYTSDNDTIIIGANTHYNIASNSSEPSYIEIYVRDTGQGIKEEDICNIFERFHTANQAGDCGSGLGLSIAKSIITKLGGSINCESRLGGGTTFTIRLPLKDSSH